MFLRIFFGYILAFLGLCGIALSALAACGAVMTDSGLGVAGIVFVISILTFFAGRALRDSAKK